MSEARVLVKTHLGVQRNDAVVLRSDERVDLHHGTIVLDKAGVQRPKGASEGLRRSAGEPERIGEVARLEAKQARAGINVDLVDEFRRGLSHVLNVHAAFCGRHDEHRLGFTIDKKGEVVLVRDGAA